MVQTNTPVSLRLLRPPPSPNSSPRKKNRNKRLMLGGFSRKQREGGERENSRLEKKGSDRKGKGWTDREVHERKGERGGSRNKSSGAEDDYRENGRGMEGEREGERGRAGERDGHRRRQTDRQ